MIKKLGKYWITQRIGKGGMGEVWSAVHIEREIPCAIKLLRPDHHRDKEYLDMFLNEAQICSQLRHGGIVRVHECGVDSGHPYIAMDLIDGVDLSVLIKKLRRSGGIHPHLAAHIISQVLEALDYAHRRTVNGREGGVIHGDVTPRNILISSHGEVLLTDFGLASFVSSASIHRNPVGTIAYMAPEQSLGCIYRLSDLYSVGAVLHEMLAHRPLRKKPYSFENLRLQADRDPPDLDRKDIPPPLEELRRALLQGHLDRRLPSARHGLDTLRTWREFRNHSRTLRKLYRSHIGPAKSGLTHFLQTPDETTDISLNSSKIKQPVTRRVPRVRSLTELAQIILDNDHHSDIPIEDADKFSTQRPPQRAETRPLPQGVSDTSVGRPDRRACMFLGRFASPSHHKKNPHSPLSLPEPPPPPRSSPHKRPTLRLSRLDPTITRRT